MFVSDLFSPGIPPTRGLVGILARFFFIIMYQVKWGFLGTILGATVLPGQLRKMANRVLGGLRHHAETGEEISKDFVPTSP